MRLAKKAIIVSSVLTFTLFLILNAAERRNHSFITGQQSLAPAPDYWILPFDSDVNVGFTPAIPHFYFVSDYTVDPTPTPPITNSLNKTLTGAPIPMEWWMGDGKNTRYWGPYACHEFWDPISPYDKDSTYRVRFNAFEIKQFLTLYQPDAGCNYAHLQFVDGSPSHAIETWENAVDGDIFGWDGTASVAYDETGRPWAIFEFTDQTIHTITKIRLLNDTFVGAFERWTQRFSISVSTTGTEMEDFNIILHTTKPQDLSLFQDMVNSWDFKLNYDWSEWDIPPTEARYVKIVIETPTSTYWRQVGELEVWEQITLADAGQSSLEASGTPKADGIEEAEVTLTLKDAGGSPLTGRTEVYDIGIYSVGMACKNKDKFGPVTETGTPGVYKTIMTSTWPGVKTLRAVVNGVVIGDAEVVFLETQTVEEPPPPDNRLVFLDGSETYPKEGWDNAVDGDFDGWDGTTSAKVPADPSQPAWAIYRFGDDHLYRFNYIYIQTDNGIPDANVVQRWAGDIEVLVSTTGTDEPDFISIARIHRYWGEWTFTRLPDFVTAKYVKILIHSAVQPIQQWYQLTEFQLHTPLKKGPEAIIQIEKAGVMEIPEVFGLDQNYPNPFNPETTIRYTLAEDARVTLKVFDVNGREVATLVDERQPAGVHSALWNASAMPSGMYFYKLTAGSYQDIKRMALVK